MPAFKSLAKEVRPPSKTLLISPGEFADEWSGRPKEPILVGLRLLGSLEEESGRNVGRAAAEAVDSADADELALAYNRALMGWMVGRAVCDPNDHTKPHRAFPAAEDTVPEALTMQALTRIFDELERHHIESTQLFREASDEEIESLQLALDSGALAALDGPRLTRARRYLAFVFDELTT